MPTTGSGKWPYPNSSAVPDVPADVLLLAQRIDLMSSGWTVTPTAVTRAALVSNGDAYEGLTVYQLDTKLTYQYLSSAWVALPGTITPTSATNGTVGASGAVTCSAVTSVSINGAFTSAYSGYQIEYDLTTSGAATLALTLRVGGVDAATAYDAQRTSTVNATATDNQALNAAAIALSGTGITGRLSGTVRLYQPAVAAATTGTVATGATANPMTSTTGNTYMAFVQHRTTTAYDGFTLTASTGNIAGWVKVTGI